MPVSKTSLQIPNTNAVVSRLQALREPIEQDMRSGDRLIDVP